MNQEEEYQIAGEFSGERLIVYDFPFAFSSQAMDEIISLLSNQTIDQLNYFFGKYLGPPADLADLLKDRRLIFI